MKQKHRFKTDKVELVLAEYKANPCEATLDELYNVIDPIILTVVSRISHTFKKKKPDDFLDLQQNVRVSIYKILKKLADISATGNQVIAVVVKATVWSLKTHYRKYKRTTPVTNVGDYYMGGSWRPEYEVPIEVPLSTVDPAYVSSSWGPEDAMVDVLPFEHVSSHYIFSVHSHKVGLWHNSNSYEYAYLKTLPIQIIEASLALNRFPEKESLVRFCLMSYLDDRTPSTVLIGKRWGESDPYFWPRYSQVLLRLAALRVLSA